MSASSANERSASRSYATDATGFHRSPGISPISTGRLGSSSSRAWFSVPLEFLVGALLFLGSDTVSRTLLVIPNVFGLGRCDHRSLALSVIVHVEELLVNFADLHIRNTESLSVGEGLDCSQLIQKD